jgi:hypothetical protein
MTVIPLAHVGGIPIEETLASFGPALLLVAGAASARLKAGIRRMRFGASGRPLADKHSSR